MVSISRYINCFICFVQIGSGIGKDNTHKCPLKVHLNDPRKKKAVSK